MLFVMFTELNISQSLTHVIGGFEQWLLYVVCYVHRAYYFSVVNSCHRSELSNDCCMLLVMFTELTISQSLAHVIGAS